jgi:hypothetical protein
MLQSAQKNIQIHRAGASNIALIAFPDWPCNKGTTEVVP